MYLRVYVCIMHLCEYVYIYDRVYEYIFIKFIYK
uniref:Uncharacterized protein n=1 Tax=viral metagenome TaxID=1070528 RepID=A0A6C0IAP3_9ZZZZ